LHGVDGSEHLSGKMLAIAGDVWQAVLPLRVGVFVFCSHGVKTIDEAFSLVALGRVRL
jgi:hypothetical protein